LVFGFAWDSGSSQRRRQQREEVFLFFYQVKFGGIFLFINISKISSQLYKVRTLHPIDLCFCFVRFFLVLGFHSFVALLPRQSFVSPSGVSTEKLSKLSVGGFFTLLEKLFRNLGGAD
jgi:hypothetical protein